MSSSHDSSNLRQVFIDSLERCSASADFIPAFYRRFICSSDEVRDKFRRTSFEEQNRMLLRSLRTIAGATSGEPGALRELRKRAETHCRYRLDIAPPLYELWEQSLIETAQSFDPEWDEGVQRAWSVILSHAIGVMVRHY